MHAPPTYREHAGGCDGDDAGGQHVERSRPTRHASGCDEPGVSRGLSEAIRGQSYAFSGLWLTNLELLEGCEMPRSLTHCRLGLLRQLVHARRPLLITDLALGTARLLGATLNGQLKRGPSRAIKGDHGRDCTCSVRSSTTRALRCFATCMQWGGRAISMQLGEGRGRSSPARLSDWWGNQHAIGGGPWALVRHLLG